MSVSAAKFLLLILMVIGRMLWTDYPTVWFCAAFWLAALAWDGLNLFTASSRKNQVFWASVNIGGYLNAIVTLANNGKMPVIGHGVSGESVWVVANESHRLLFLCDRFARFSIGDLLMFTGGVVTLVIWLADKVKNRGEVPENASEADSGSLTAI